MTIVDERPSLDAELPLTGPADRPHISTASWRLAGRLARREVRRRPGRTVLVALLVAVPILAMTFGSIVVRSTTEQAAYARNFGTSDFAVDQYSSVGDNGVPRPPVRLGDLQPGTLPSGTATTNVLSTYTSITGANGNRVEVAATHVDSASPIIDGLIDVTSGRLPADGSDEVLLQPGLARELGVVIGDRLTLERPDRTLEVVGTGRASADHGRALMLFGTLDRNELRNWQLTTLFDLPTDGDAETTLDAIVASGALTVDQTQGLDAHTPEGYWYPGGGLNSVPIVDGQTLAWGWVIGVLALVGLGVIIAAAFATSARRQLATVGQLAANGASPRLIRRTLSLQGTWSGAAGAVVGIALGIGVFLLGTPLVERIVGRSWTDTSIAPLDMVVLLVTGIAAATIAALLPARSLANTSVLSALAGRRPIRPVRARTVTAGLACFAGGLFLLAVATAGGSSTSGNDDLFALVAVLGGLGVLAGMCLASPLTVTAATALCSKLGASWRLSGRSLSRTRWRSAAVATAIGVAGAFAVAGASVASNADARSEGPTDLPRNVVILRGYDGANVATVDPMVLTSVRTALGPTAESMVYGLDLAPPTERQLIDAEPDPSSPDFDPTAPDGGLVRPVDVTIADDALLDGMGLSRTDRSALDEIGAINLWSNEMNDGPNLPETPRDLGARILSAEVQVDFDAAPLQEPIVSRNGTNGYLMTERQARALGIGIAPTGIRFTADADLTAAQRRALDEIRFGDDVSNDSWIVGNEPSTFPTNGGQGFWIDYQWVDNGVSATFVEGAIVVATLLLVLLVVAIGLSLAAVESRDERNTLIAVGASPSMLRRRSATTATVLAATGGVMAIPAGLLPVWVVVRVNHGNASVPWLSIVAIVVVIPLLVGAIALVGSAVIQRVRPPKVMQAFTD